MVVKSPQGAEGEARLKEYWLTKGLPRWAEKPHPWTSLVRELERYVRPDIAKGLATELYHMHFGDYPGSDTAHLRSGKPIRGKVIGRG